MRFVFMADLHAHNFTECATVTEDGLNSRLVDVLNVVKETFDYAIEWDIPWLVVGGDIFHHRRSVSNDVLCAVQETFVQQGRRKGAPKVLVYDGNHDICADAPRYRLTEALRGAVTVIVHECSIVSLNGFLVGVIPYQENGQELKRMIKTVSKESVELVLMHQGVQGVVSRSGYVLGGETLKKSALPKKLTLSGHIHEEQQVTSLFRYVGSPLQHDWGDAHIPKYFYDVDDMSVKRVPTSAPTFRNVRASKVPASGLENSFVRLVALDGKEAELAEKLAPKLSNRVLHLAPTLFKYGGHWLEVQDEHTYAYRRGPVGLIDDYVDSVEEKPAKRSVLKKTGRSILHEATQAGGEKLAKLEERNAGPGEERPSVPRRR